MGSSGSLAVIADATGTLLKVRLTPRRVLWHPAIHTNNSLFH